MKQYQINKAFNALSRLANMQLAVRDARNIYMLSKQLEDSYNFELGREKMLVEKYHGTLSKDGGLRFCNTDEANAFGKELSELTDMDIDVEFDPVTINCDAMGDQRISPFDVACLDGFVIFE